MHLLQIDVLSLVQIKLAIAKLPVDFSFMRRIPATLATLKVANSGIISSWDREHVGDYGIQLSFGAPGARLIELLALLAPFWRAAGEPLAHRHRQYHLRLQRTRCSKGARLWHRERCASRGWHQGPSCGFAQGVWPPENRDSVSTVLAATTV